MVEPMWLEQAYIVQNEIMASDDSLFDSAVIDDASVDVKVTPYRQFVDQNPNLVSYFQPILDRLSVVPSKFDLNAGGVIVEGKSDYYILQYLNANYFGGKLNIFPVTGAGTMGTMIGLMKGWGLPVRILLDADKAGNKEKERYQTDYFLSEIEVTTLRDLSSNLKEIEDLFNDEDRKRISKILAKSSKTTKKDILTVMQEHLASGKRVKLTADFSRKAKKLIKEVENYSK